MKKNQEKQDEAAEKLVNDFIRRCNVADSILRYSFRLDIDTKKKNKKSSGNHALNTSIQGINKKLELMPYFNGFFVEGPSEFREGEREVKGLKLSDLDVAAVFRRKSKSLEKISIIKEVQETHNKAESGQSNDQIAKKVIVGIVETYKDLIELRKEDKLTSADRLYIRISVEQALGVQLVMRLWNNVVKVYNTMGTAFFDRESVTRLDKIFKCNNILNRAELVDIAFEALNAIKKGKDVTTWKEVISNDIYGNLVTTAQREDDVQKWKNIYEEGVAFFSEWCIPLYNTCFCVLLYSAVKNETKDSAEILKKMFAYLSSYINENQIEFESGISEDTLLELKKIKRRPEIIRALSDYIIGMLDQPETMEAPITLFELDKMIPKKANGDYLKYMKLQFIERNKLVIGWSPEKS